MITKKFYLSLVYEQRSIKNIFRPNVGLQAIGWAMFNIAQLNTYYSSWKNDSAVMTVKYFFKKNEMFAYSLVKLTWNLYNNNVILLSCSSNV
jgi:hypothetical protein